MSYEESSALAHLSQEQACRTEDHKEEVEAFLENGARFQAEVGVPPLTLPLVMTVP